MRSSLLEFWPTPEDVDACVRSEAEAVNEAVFLAVHQQMPLRKVEVGGERRGSRATEHDLLEHLTVKNPSEGRVIIPIIGESGVGKSHLVKWLGTQLKHDKHCKHYHVIRIPKGSSLRGVLGLILDGLSGPDYDSIRSALDGAREQLDPKLAAGLLRLYLVNELENASSRAADAIEAGSASREDKTMRAWGRTSMLPSLLGDEILWADHFHRAPSAGDSGPIALIAEHVTQAGGAVEDKRKHQFDASDLAVPVVDPNDLNARARNCYKRLLSSPQDRDNAALVLNQVLDAAKRQLLKLGDSSLSELFVGVRRALHSEGRELVLLVEDFAVLSGLQGPLLDVMIREAVRDGRQDLCTMRSVLAYTAGYLTHETVRTRAQYEWWIDEDPGRLQDPHGRCVELVGAYLNAARNGAAELEASLTSSVSSSSDWVPRVGLEGLEEETVNSVLSFGQTDSGFPLFPFNHSLILHLAKEGSQRNGQFVFNPRFVINNVIRKVLDHRPTFELGEFPPELFGSRTLEDAALRDELSVNVPSDHYDRYLKLLAYWGNQPQSSQAILDLPPGLFEAFGLKPPQLREAIGTMRPPRTAVAPGGAAVPAVTPPVGADVFEEQWRKELEEWANHGMHLSQGRANKLRGYIRRGVKASLPTDWPGMRNELKDTDLRVFIPKARGESPEPDLAFVALCTEEELRDPSRNPRLLLELEAIIRTFESCTLDAERESGRYANFVARHRSHALEWLRQRYFRTPCDPLGLMTELQIAGALALGLPDARYQPKRDLVHSLFLPSKDQPSAVDGPWPEMVHRLYEARPETTNHLVRRIGVFQGSGTKPHAIDFSAISGHLDALKGSWIPNTIPPKPLGTDKGFREFVAHYSAFRRGFKKAVEARVDSLDEFRERALSWLGSDFDKSARIEELRRFLTASKRNNLADDHQIEALRRLLSRTKDTQIKKTIDLARKRTKSGTLANLARLGSVEAGSVRLIENLEAGFSALFTEIEEKLTSFRTTYGGQVTNEQIKQLASTMGQVQSLLKELEEL